MFGDTLQRGVEGVRDRLPETERGQVGIGTLIVFIAMVLVAAIAAGVLINTAGFLQSKSQQTGEESSEQVTNQLQVVSKTGIVNNGEESSAEMLTLGVVGTNSAGSGGGNSDAGNSTGTLPIDSGTTFEVTVKAGTDDFPKVNVTTNNIDGELVLGDESTVNGEATNEVTITRFETDSGTERVRLTNEDTGSSITFDAGDKLVLQDAPASNTAKEVGTNGNTASVDVTFAVTYQDSTFGETVIEQTATVPDSTDSGGEEVYQIPTVAENRTSSYIQLVSNTVSPQSDGTVRVNDGESVTVTTGGTLENADGQTLSVSAEDTLTFDLDADGESFEVTNEDTGSAITVASDGGLGVPGTGGAHVALSDGNETVVVSSDTGNNAQDFRTLSALDVNSEPNRYLFTRNLASGNTVTQVDLLVAGSAGAGDIDMRQTVISARTPQGSFTLNYGQTTIENEQFAITAVQDDSDTAPVLTSGDRFEINLDLGTLEGGDTVELRITTGAGATKVVQLRVPDSLANKEAVGL
jgi:flagellin FlaA/flagellin FlaB